MNSRPVSNNSNQRGEPAWTPRLCVPCGWRFRHAPTRSDSSQRLSGSHETMGTRGRRLVRWSERQARPPASDTAKMSSSPPDSKRASRHRRRATLPDNHHLVMMWVSLGLASLGVIVRGARSASTCSTGSVVASSGLRLCGSQSMCRCGVWLEPARTYANDRSASVRTQPSRRIASICEPRDDTTREQSP